MNSQYVTVATFMFPTELHIVKGKLESEGIECFVKDELTVQTHNFYSNAVGGVKLQVKQSDVELALEILNEAGYIIKEETTPPKFWVWLDTKTKKIPVLNQIHLVLRFLILSTIIIFFLAAIIYKLTLPSTSEYLVSNLWCLDYIEYEGEVYIPPTQFFQLSGINCTGMIHFEEDGEIYFPVFNNEYIYGKWEVEGKTLTIKDVSYFHQIFEGEYSLQKNLNKLTLMSEKTTIYCRRL